jgi:hypothetical protein
MVTIEFETQHEMLRAQMAFMEDTRDLLLEPHATGYGFRPTPCQLMGYGLQFTCREQYHNKGNLRVSCMGELPKIVDRSKLPASDLAAHDDALATSKIDVLLA